MALTILKSWRGRLRSFFSIKLFVSRCQFFYCKCHFFYCRSSVNEAAVAEKKRGNNRGLDFKATIRSEFSLK